MLNFALVKYKDLNVGVIDIVLESIKTLFFLICLLLVVSLFRQIIRYKYFIHTTVGVRD